jgi:hypothetical protein
MATRAKANGSLISNFRSPIYVTPPFDVSVSSLSIKHSSSLFNPWRSRDVLYNEDLEFYNICGHK